MHKNLECQVHEPRQIGSGQTRDGKSEHRHSRNQRTESCVLVVVVAVVVDVVIITVD